MGKMRGSWVQVAAPIIADVLANTRGLDEKTIKTALYDAYPFGERHYHPYKVWLREIRRQRVIKIPRKQPEPPLTADYIQISLFD